MHGPSLSIHTVVLIRGFGHTNLGRDFSDGFLEGDDGVRFNDFTLGILLLKIVQTDFNVELTTSGNDVLTTLFSGADD
jgi:hypothetical protein